MRILVTALLLSFFITSVQASTSVRQWDFSYLAKEISKRTYLDLGYSLANFLESYVTTTNGVGFNGNRSEGAFRLGARYRFLNLPHFFSLSAGLGYETPRTFKENKLIAGGSPLLDTSHRLSYWDVNFLVHADLPQYWEIYGGLSYSIPFISNSNASIGGDWGFLAGGSYWWTKNFSTGLNYRISSFDYTVVNKTYDMSLSGFEIKTAWRFQ